MKTATLRAHAPRLARLLAQMQKDPDALPEKSSQAAVAGVSRRQLDRIFRREFGESPRACQRRLRLERAARQLRHGRRRILAIGLECGYESHEAFTRAFTRRFGAAPAAYRRLRIAHLGPAGRREQWQRILAGGLRRHVERAAD